MELKLIYQRLIFDFSKPFCIRSTSKNENLPSKESLFYLEFELNLNFQEIADFFKTKYYSIKCLSRRYGFPSKTPEQYQKRKRELYKFRTGYSWTILDPKKRKIARENNLNFREFFSKKEFEDWFEQFKILF